MNYLFKSLLIKIGAVCTAGQCRGGGSVTEPMSSLQKWKFETENKVLIVIFVLTVILKVLHLYLLSITVFFFILINAGLSKLPVLEDLECGLLGGNRWELSIPTIASYTNFKKIAD